MDCSIQGITNAVATEDKTKTEKIVREIRKMSAMERAALGNTPMTFITSIAKNLKPTLDGKKVYVLDIERSNEGVFTLKYKTDGEVFTAEVGDVGFETSNKAFPLDHSTLSVLYSDYDNINNFDDFEQLALDITNNPEKILSTAEALIEADEYHNDESHNSVLRSQLAGVVDALIELVPQLNIHINKAGDRNIGTIDTSTGDVYISKGIGGSKSLMEIYVHELYHAVTHFAIDRKNTATRGVTARMEKVRDHFLNHTTEQDLVRTSGNTLTEEQAAELLDYLSDSKIGLHEFVALSMSNKAVMNQLKQLNIGPAKTVSRDQPLFYRLLDAVYEIFKIAYHKATKEPRDNDFQRMLFLVNKLHQAHKKPLEARRLTSIRNLISVFEPLERKWSDFLVQKKKEREENISRNVPKEGESDLRHYGRMFYRAFFDEQAQDIVANSLSLLTVRGGYNPLRPEGTIRSIIRDMQQGDHTQRNAEQMSMMSSVIDQKREFTAVGWAKVVLNGFSRALSKEEEWMLTDIVLDTDLSTLYKNFEGRIKSFLGSNSEIDKAIKELIAKLETLTDKKSVNFYNSQTTLLADYMANHEDNIALLKNAHNIARKLGTTDEDYSVSDDIIELIDELASLKALRKVPKTKRAKLSALMDTEPEGISNLVAFQGGQKDFAAKHLFPTISDKINIIKGYSAQITNPDIEVTSAPMERRAEMEAQGYKLVDKLAKHDMDGNRTAVGLFINNKFVLQNFHRIGMRMTDKGRRGTTITQSYSLSGESNPTLKAARDIQKMKVRRDEVIRLMHEGKYEALPSDSMISPNFNKAGQVVDFSYGMTKELKINLLDMERKVSTVIGRTAASTYDKKETEKFNESLMELIRKDAEENLNPKRMSIIGKNSKEYIEISKDSNSRHVQTLWKILPGDIKRKYPKGFMVRRDLMFTYLGYREMSIAELPGIKQFFDINSTARTAMIKHAVQFAEKLWQELIKISKADVIIRTPGVFIGNVVSNFMLMYVSGHSFKEITTMKYQGVKELRSYIADMKLGIELEAKQQAGILTKTEERKLSVIQNNLQNSPVKDLVDEGFYTTIIEEMEHGADTGSYFNKLAKKKLQNVPKIFTTGVDLLYITENTKLFKLIEKGIQASDFAARYAQYHLLIERGTPKEDAIAIVRDNYINYNTPNSRFVEWANRMGFIMFTKYFTRIQKVIHRYGKNHPAKLLLSILAQNVVLGDLDTFDDQSILTKDMGNLFYNPWDNMMRVFTPSSLEAVDWVVNGGR